MQSNPIHISIFDFADPVEASAIAAVFKNHGQVHITHLQKARQMHVPLNAPNFGVFVIHARGAHADINVSTLVERSGARYFSHALLLFVGSGPMALNADYMVLQGKHSWVWVNTPTSFEQLQQELKRQFRLFRKEMQLILKVFQIRQSEIEKHEAARRFEKELKKLIKANYQNSAFQTVDLAQLLGVSVSTLERKALKHCDRLPKQLLTDYRLQKVREALENTHMTMKAIALKTGFSSASYMSIRFQEIHGVQPSVYRSAQLKKIAS